MATGGLKTAASLWALIPMAEQSNIKKMSDNRLRDKLTGARYRAGKARCYGSNSVAGSVD